MHRLGLDVHFQETKDLQYAYSLCIRHNHCCTGNALTGVVKNTSLKKTLRGLLASKGEGNFWW